MGWYLLRKPYPGLQEEDRIDIAQDVVLVGRGRECSKHCLSIFVSRRHLHLIAKDDGSLNIKDLGSSNGTFVNLSQIEPNVDFPLKVGDEIGIGNVNSDNKDCYVYKVHLQDNNLYRIMSSPLHQSSDEEHNVGEQNQRYSMERGLKRFAMDPDEIVVMDDDDEGDVSGANLPGESMSHLMKRPKTDHTVAAPVQTQDVSSGLNLVEDLKSRKPSVMETIACLKEEEVVNRKTVQKPENLGPARADSKDSFKPLQKPVEVEVEVLHHKETSNSSTDQAVCCRSNGSNISCVGHNSCSLTTPQLAEVHESTTGESFEKAKDRRLSHLLDGNWGMPSRTVKLSSPSSVSKDISMPLCSTLNLTKLVDLEDVNEVHESTTGESFKKAKDSRLSLLLDGNCDTSSRTVKLSSPSSFSKDVSMPLYSTPNPTKQADIEGLVPILPSAYCHKLETSFSSMSRGADMSPIMKETESKQSQSSLNYTLDEDIIPIDVSDDEESFPCSQMFAADEDVKPSIPDSPKDIDIVDLSLDDDVELNKEARDEGLDEIIVLGSSDDDEDDIADADRWFKRLSQSSIKKELDDSANEQEKEAVEEDFLSSEKIQDLQSSVPKYPHDTCHEDVDLIEIDVQYQEGVVNEIECRGDGTDKKEMRPEVKLTSRTDKTREEKHTKQRSKHKRKDKEREKSKEEHTREKRAESKSYKHRKKHSKHESSKTKVQSLSEKLRSIFSDGSSDEEPHHSPQQVRKPSLESASKVMSTSSKPGSDKSFDDLFRSFKESQMKEPQKLKEKEPSNCVVTLNRLENNTELCEQYGLSSASRVKLPPSSESTFKKPSRRTEMVEALPNPPRKACNRGISESSTKVYKNDKSVEDKRSTHELQYSKPPKIKDAKTIRKERLAQVAVAHASKKTESSDGKRAAPARVKNTETNRGSFLIIGDENSSKSKLKSRMDIIKSSKIPKVKDKAVTHYPTKSPLESMNMSWEKEKPMACTSSSSTSSSSAPHERVEIPTGPQPKKRVAQVPFAGFYKDVSSVPETTTSTMKSCLSSSSKHNIAINNKSKPNKTKKKVTFKENLEQVFYIESICKTKSVNSYKDADRPKAMSQVPAATNPQAILPNDETVFQELIYDICKWNPLWLKEEKNLPPDTLPPVVPNMNLPTIPRTEFVDFEEYHSIMYPLLMLELWNGISKGYNNHPNDSSNMLMAVDHASTSTVASRPDRMLTTLKCHMPLYERNADYPKRGDLVMIELRIKDSSGKTCVISVFGYVDYEMKDTVSNSAIFHKELVNAATGKLPIFKIRFSLLIRERKNCTYILEKPMRIKNVKYIRGDLRVFFAMKNLQHTPLRYSIISPNAGNEDLSLPDVSSINLALPDKLNSTQKKIVLQTGEVCRQAKPKICLIQGPPGTGKSHVIASLVLQLLYRDQNYTRANREKGLVPRILLCAPSNAAVDILVKRLLHRRSKIDHEQRFKMVRVGNDACMNPEVKGISLFELAKNVQKNDNIQVAISTVAAKLQGIEHTIALFTERNQAIPEELKFRHADNVRKLKVLKDRQKEQSKPSNTNENFAVRKEAMKKVLGGADIVATTLNSCVINIMETVFPTRQNKYNFPVCIVDEATQCLEVETLIPLLLGVKTLVLVGDHKQLPATVLSKAAKEKGLGTSLFARLQKVVPNAVQVLDTQYRMHPEILQWPNKFFYDSILKTPERFSTFRESKVKPYVIVSLPFKQDFKGESNHEEAKFVVLLAELLVHKEAVLSTPRVGIVTPYRSQASVIRNRLGSHLTDTVEVNTIDSYQGQEKDIIIFSCVRTTGVGFMSDRQRLNVALTRARYALFLCGNFSSLDRDSMWNNLLTDARQRRCVLELRNQQWNNKEELWNLIKRR